MTLPPLRYAKTSDRVNIAYFSVGEGPAIVFSSNILGDAHFYRTVWPHVRNVTDGLVDLGWQVVLYDVRGMGASDHDVADLSLEARIRDLEAVVDRLDLQRFALAAIDLGAPAAVAYTVRHPAAVSHLVLVSPWASGEKMFSIPAVRMAASATALSKLIESDSSAATHEREWEVFRQMLASIVTGLENHALVRQLSEIIRLAVSAKGLAEFYRQSQQIDVTKLLPDVTTPTLVVHESGFPFGSYELCRNVAAEIENAQLVVIEGPSIAGTAHEGHVLAIDGFLRGGGTAALARGSTVGRGALPDGLTAREAQVLGRVAAGLTNKQIAIELHIAVPTVERHLVNAYAKIGARGRALATAYVLRHGLETSTA